MTERVRDGSSASPRRRGNWRRWALWAALAVALYAGLGFFLVPRVARSQIQKLSHELLHREAKLARVRFNPFTLAGTVEGFDLSDRDGSDLFHLDRLAFNLQVTGIFRRAWRFREIVVEGPHAVARIGADGRPTVADLFESESGGSPAGEKSSIPRLIIDRFAVARGGAEFVDDTRAPRFVERFEPIDLELRDLTTIPDESGGHTISLGVAGGAKLRWSGRQTITPLRFEGKVDITDVHLARMWNYLAAANPLEVRDGVAAVACSYEVSRGPEGRLALRLDGVGVSVRDLALRPRSGGDDWLTVPRVEIAGARAAWPDATVELPEVRVTGPRALAWLAPDGSVNWQAAVANFMGAPREPSPAAPGGSAPTPGKAGKPWSVKVAVVEVQGAGVRFEDRRVEPNVTIDLADADFELRNISSDLTAPVSAKFAARINGAGETSVTGTIVPEPPSADLEVDLRGLEIAPFEVYAVHLPGMKIRRGVAGAKGRLRLGEGSPRIQFDGGLDLTDFLVSGAELDRALECKRAIVTGATVTVFPERIRLKKVDLDGAFAAVHIDREGNINLKRISVAAPEASAPGRTGAPSEPLRLEITTVTIRNSSAEFTDQSLVLPFGTRIQSIEGSVKDLSTTGTAAARLALKGRIADAGYFQSDGTIRISAPFASSDVGVLFRGVNMPDLTPYSAQFAGYSIQQGALDLDVRYRIQDGRLVGDHRVVATDLTLGGKVEGADAPGLPVRLAIALLKDKDGRIDLEVPIEGTIDSPEFNYRSVFWQAFKKILGNVAKAPFRAIGRLFGADQDDLELVGFPAGRSDLPAPEQEKLSRLAAELVPKIEITVEVEGRFDPVTDVEAIRRARIEQRIEAERESAPSLEAILEQLFVESFSADRLLAERQKFTPIPAPEDAAGKRKKGVDAPPPAPFDAAGFYDSLRAQLLSAEEVPASELAELGRSRAAAIAAALTAPGGLDPARVRTADPSPVKRKKQGSELVASEMTLAAGD